jgi:hypothetical protein
LPTEGTDQAEREPALAERDGLRAREAEARREPVHRLASDEAVAVDVEQVASVADRHLARARQLLRGRAHVGVAPRLGLGVRGGASGGSAFGASALEFALLVWTRGPRDTIHMY